jgi:hypothetical protein
MLFFKSMINWNLKLHRSSPKVLSVQCYSPVVCELSQEEPANIDQFQTRTAIAEFPHEKAIQCFLDARNAL